MPHGEHSPMDYYPRRLYQAEIQNPYTVFHSFFDAFALPEAIEFIEAWLRAVTKDDFWKKGYPARLLFFYEMLEKLIEGAYLVNKLDNQKDAALLNISSEAEMHLMSTSFYCGWHTGYSAWDYFPRSLPKKQFINPYLTFRKFFKYQELPIWRDQLYDLLYNAFVGHKELDTDEYCLLNVQKHLKRIIEAAHLVEVRTGVKIKQEDEALEK